MIPFCIYGIYYGDSLKIRSRGRKNVESRASMVGSLDDGNKDVQDTTEITEGDLFKCKICGVKFDNATAYEGHIAAGHVTPSS